MENTATKINVLENTDYFFIFKELENLVNYTSEKEIIWEVFELLNSLFSPLQIVYIDFSQDKNGQSMCYKNINNINQQIESYHSFTLEIVHRNEFLGVFEIYGVRFPEYIEEYKKIGSVICSICRVAIINARKFAIIQSEKEQLESYSNKLSEMVQSKDKFFSIIAHDLRAPFSSFMGLATILADEFTGISFHEIKHLTSKMKNNASSLFEMLENLLEWSRCQQGLIIYNPEKVDFHSVAEDSIKLLKETALQKNIQITYDFPKDLTVYADLKMLQTVLRNLVSNGLKFTPKGGKIVISANNRKDGMVRISIRDTGIGIPGIMLNSLFSIKEKTNRKGTEGEPSSGLGLLLCKELIEKHGSVIRVESEEGKGTTFSFTLPEDKQTATIGTEETNAWN